MDLRPSPRQTGLVDRARVLATEHFAPRAEKYDRAGAGQGTALLKRGVE